MLSTFAAEELGQGVTIGGFGALTSSLIYNCPRLTRMYLGSRHNQEPSDRELVEKMVNVADCTHRVRFKVFQREDAHDNYQGPVPGELGGVQDAAGYY